MGSIVDKINDDIEEKQERLRAKKLREIATGILSIAPSDKAQFSDIMYLFANEEKILRNRRLIDLLG